MNLRALTRNDIPFLISIRKDFPDAWDENMLDSAFRAGNFYGFVAEETDGGLPVGFITYSINMDAADLQDLFVIKEKRRQGIANALLSAFITDAKSRNIKKLFLEVRESNTAALNLYKAARFTFLSARKRYYADGEDANVLIKEL